MNVIRAVFPLLERVAPRYATGWAARLFITPVRFGFTEKEKRFLQRVECFDLEVGDKTFRAYRMGQGPEVVCVHGWSGRALQFRKFAEHLAERGYTFLAFDAWGHGKSGGKRSSLFEFSGGLKAMHAQCKDPVAVIGHSLGAAAVSLAVSEGPALPRFVALAAPVVAQDILDDFCRIVRASPKVQEGIRRKAVLHFNRSFDEVAMERTIREVHCPVLALHGEADKDVNVRHVDIMKAAQPAVQAERLPGIGHRSILKTEAVIQRVIDWIEARP